MEQLTNFTNLYSLSKTLRFELIPQGKTLETFSKWIEEFNEKETSAENLFAKDKNIFDAYVALKPILDKIHEEFITYSLESEIAKGIKFEKYYELYKKRQNKEKDDDSLSKIEKALRESIGETYKAGKELFDKNNEDVQESIIEEPESYDEDDNESDNEENKKKKSVIKFLMDKSIINHIDKFVKKYVSEDLTEEKLKAHLATFKGFYTYFSGYNINRRNYYEFKEEKATAIATRIVHENLPTFCDNVIRFEDNKDDYLKIYEFLKDKNIITEIKNATTDTMTEIECIKDDIFKISHFSDCLSQLQIEEYNRYIRSYNYLINLYNQSHRNDKDYKKIDEFEILYKQIGCGTKKELLFALIKSKENELTEKQKQQRNAILTVEKTLNIAIETGKKYFEKDDSSQGIRTIPDFMDWLRNCEDWNGIYWSKVAVTKISNTYFANWHDLKDKLKGNKACVSFDKNREEQIKLNDAVELSGLFTVLDQNDVRTVFKNSVFENFKDVINYDLSPSKNLINFLCADIEKNIIQFLNDADNILNLEKYKEDKNEEEEDKIIKQIKDWFDCGINVIRLIKYFAVRKSKRKGSTNSTIEQALRNLLYSDDTNWFKWYDAVRNYLTKKPQDDVKENTLKLNFGSSSLLGGWSDGQEKVKRATLLKNEDDVYLCILKETSIFDTSKEDNPIYTKNGTSGRLILRTLGFKTLSGKGFVSVFNETYSNMSIRDPQKAIKSLQQIIKDRYSQKYPLLNKFVENVYTEKKEFDAEIQKTLKDCYECYFRPIDWQLVLDKEKQGDLFLFKIHSKDLKKESKSKQDNKSKDLQTLYWENVLKEDSMHQLCAGAEIFMREPIKTKKTYKHKLGEYLVNRKDKDGNSIPELIYRELFKWVNDGKKDKLSEEAEKYRNKISIKPVKYEIIKDKRFYLEEKYFFHCPIRLNYNSKSYKEPKFGYQEVNTEINEKLQQIPNLYFIGIDRGEKNLVYYCIVDKNENIIECEDCNIINGTNYLQRLEEKTTERQKSRQGWQAIGNISNLKDGYISHVVHEIVTKASKGLLLEEPQNGAYIVLEDLNTEMKQSRQKIEKQVYQKLEVALAKKLNFVVDKTVAIGRGSVENALQLTPPIANYGDIEGKKQFGIMLYTRANYTSITDPVTGWRKTIHLKAGTEEDIKNQIEDNFTEIAFDGQDYYFEYTEKHVGKKWRLYSGKDGKSLPRFKNNKQKKEDKDIWEPELIDVRSILDKVFEFFDKKQPLLAQIKNGTQLEKIPNRKETAWESLRFAIDLIQQIRNNGKEKEDDNFLYSPVRNNAEEHFDSRSYLNQTNPELPQDADANGAFNIARKGLIMNAHIEQWIKNGKKKVKKDKKEVSDLDLFVSDQEWDMWLLDREKWEQTLPVFASKSEMDKYRNLEKSETKVKPKRKRK